MVRGASGTSGGGSRPAGGKPSLTPLILFAASPGTITGVITIAVSHSSSSTPVSAMIAVAVAAFVMWLVLVMVAYKGHSSSGPSLARSVIQCLMGLIVMAMGTQFSLTGLIAFISSSSAAYH